QQADNFSGNVAELMIATEIELTGRSREEILTIMSRNLTVMKATIVDGLTESKSVSGLTGGDAAKLDAYMKSGKTLSDSAVLSAA
ncbi:L-serine ammonia-lyase, iron-sulfur-dependent, subunit alpha, partial [Streptococcus suis]